MSVAMDFMKFCSNLKIKNKGVISEIYKKITKRLNKDFWNNVSETSHSLYVGSFGRDTAIHGFSDLDMIFQLPSKIYKRFNNYSNNGQSALLQEVKNSILKTYPNTDIGGDGQVVVISFTNGIQFEVVPAFINDVGSYTYPDSNNGGKWKITNPKPEINEIDKIDKMYHLNLKRLCRMMRAWKDKWTVSIGGLLIDTLACNFIKNWEHREKSFPYYDKLSCDFFNFLSNQDRDQQFWKALGSNQPVKRIGLFENKAEKCYNLSLEAIEYESEGYIRLSKQKWGEIYGSEFPS
ncbi:MAG: nucleotidyltransferase [Nitrospirae bacterium YQR-1]